MAVKNEKLLLALLTSAVVLLLVRALRRSRGGAAAAWSDVPSAPEWYPTPAEPRPLPIEDYDALRAVDIAATLRKFDDADEIQRVLDYEQAHNQRVTVFRAAKARLRALEAAQEPMRVGA
jgi:hypothetical protein